MSQEGENTGKRIELRLPKITIDHKVWPNPKDKLNRQPEIENLSDILLNVQSPLVFALEAPWGDGKSTFIKLWEQYLAYNKKSYVTLNAWESDFCEDPMLPLLSAFDKWVDQQNGYSVGKRAWGKAKKMAPGVLKSIAVSGVKAGTLGALDLNDAVEGALSEVAGGITGDIVDAFNQRLSLLEQFKGALKGALDLLPEGQGNLIVFVDELDRCRPSYAIELLERIKHLFDVEGVVFVLSMNREQLGNSLGGIYGSKFDGIGYLKRFVDIDYQLKVPDIEAYVNSKLYQPEVKSRAASSTNLRDQMDFLKIALSWLSEKYGYSMRDINRIIVRLRLVLRSFPTSQSIYPHLMVLLMFLRERDKEQYDRLISSPVTLNEVFKEIFKDEIESGEIPKALPVFVGYSLGQLIPKEYRSSIMQFWADVREKYEASSEAYKSIVHLMDIANDLNGYDGASLLKLMHQRVELIENLSI